MGFSSLNKIEGCMDKKYTLCDVTEGVLVGLGFDYAQPPVFLDFEGDSFATLSLRDFRF
jgi:hypothetical protein